MESESPTNNNTPMIGMFGQLLEQMQARVPEIQTFLNSNPGMSDLDIYKNAKRFNVSPLELAMATGENISNVMERYNLAERLAMLEGGGANQEQQMNPNTDRIKSLVKDKALEGLVQGMMGASPLAPYVPLVKPGIKFLDKTFKRWF